MLPVTLPDTYLFIGPGFEQSKDGLMFVRTTDFRLGGPQTSQVIEICVAGPGSTAGVCVPSGAEGQTITRTSGAYPVWIRPLGSDEFTAEARAFWTGVGLSADLDAIGWLT